MTAQFDNIFGSDPGFAGGTGAGGDVDRALGRVTYDESALAFALTECAQELERVTGERDRAREENARFLAAVDSLTIPDADPSSSYIAGVADGYTTAVKHLRELLAGAS